MANFTLKIYQSYLFIFQNKYNCFICHILYYTNYLIPFYHCYIIYIVYSYLFLSILNFSLHYRLHFMYWAKLCTFLLLFFFLSNIVIDSYWIKVTIKFWLCTVLNAWVKESNRYIIKIIAHLIYYEIVSDWVFLKFIMLSKPLLILFIMK